MKQQFSHRKRFSRKHYALQLLGIYYTPHDQKQPKLALINRSLTFQQPRQCEDLLRRRMGYQPPVAFGESPRTRGRKYQGVTSPGLCNLPLLNDVEASAESRGERGYRQSTVMQVVATLTEWGSLSHCHFVPYLRVDNDLHV